MLKFGTHVKDIKPRVRVPAVVTQQRSPVTFTGALSQPEKFSDLVIQAIYAGNDKKKFGMKLVIYMDKKTQDFWWGHLNRYGSPLSSFVEGPFLMVHTALFNALTFLELDTTDVYRIS